MPAAMIETRHLSKRYGSFLAVDDLSFAVPPGEICGFLGPNGAGKSTTIKMLTGFHPPSSGSATVAGFDIMTQGEEARRHIGYLPESNPVYPEMRVEEYLHFFGQLYGMNRTDRVRRIKEVIPRCGLEKVHTRTIGHLSKGNRQRVGLASAILHEPKVLILDEPTSGLDPAQMLAFRDLIFELRGKHTILLSSHYIPQIEQAAGYVVIIANGKLAAAGTPAQLREKASLGAPVLVEAIGNAGQVMEVLKRITGVGEVAVMGETGTARLVVRPQGTVDLRQAISAALAEAKIPLCELRQEAATLEDFFVASTAGKRVMEEGR